MGGVSVVSNQTRPDTLSDGPVPAVQDRVEGGVEIAEPGQGHVWPQRQGIIVVALDDHIDTEGHPADRETHDHASDGTRGFHLPEPPRVFVPGSWLGTISVLLVRRCSLFME